MRIFFASAASPNPAFPSTLWRDNLCLPLRDLGHEVVEFDYDLTEVFRNLDPQDPRQRQFIQRHRPRLGRALLRQLAAAHAAKPVDLFFSYFYDACVPPAAIDEIRKMGIVTVNWYCNASYQFHLVSEIAPHYDWCLVPEKFRLADYQGIGARPLYCQEAANPKIYRPYDVAKAFDVSFVGQAYGERPQYIRFLAEHGIDIRVWGSGWEFYSDRPPRKERGPASVLRKAWFALQGESANRAPATANSPTPRRIPAGVAGGLLSDQEMIETFSRSRINLGFSTCGETHLANRIKQVRLRDFEVPMSGGFYLVEYFAELEEFYDIGREIACFQDPEDLADKIRHFLKHEDQREAIRRAGYERCQRDHTWQGRLAAAFGRMRMARP